MPEEAEKPETLQTVRITAELGLRMRSGPGTDYDVIKTLPFNTFADIDDSEDAPDGWFYVKQGEDSGYISAEYAVPDSRDNVWKYAYAAFLQNPDNYNYKNPDNAYLESPATVIPYETFTLHDIDGNGIPELIIYFDAGYNAGNIIRAYAFEDDKIDFIGTLGGYHLNLHIPKDKNVKEIYDVTIKQGLSSINAYAVINGKAEAVDSFSGTDMDTEFDSESGAHFNFDNTTALDSYRINSFNIANVIYGYGINSSANLHPYATALREFFKNTTESKTGAWLRDVDGDGVEEMIASQYEIPKGDMGEVEIRHRFFYIRDGKLLTYDTETVNGLAYMGYPQLIFSDNDELVLYEDGVLGRYSIFSFKNGVLKPDAVNLEAKNYFDSPNSDYLLNEVKISESEYNAYLRQYGLDKLNFNYLYESTPPDETAKILLMSD